MALLDQWGRKFAHAARRDRYRGPLWNNQDVGIDDLIPSYDRQTLCTLSRRLVFNRGPAKEAIRQKASYSVGQAWIPSYEGSDADIGKDVCGWLKRVWFPICDIRGGCHDWWSFLRLVSKSMDRDGECFIQPVVNGRGMPKLKVIPNYLCKSDPELETVEASNIDSFNGYSLEDGVIVNGQGAVVGYRIVSDVEDPYDAENWHDYSANQLWHVFDDDHAERNRGFPAFSSDLDQIKASFTSEEQETIRMQLISSMYYFDKGRLDENDAGNERVDSISTGKGEIVQTNQPGVRYISDDEGGGIETVTHDAPGAVWESFQDRLWRSAINTVWVYDLVWKTSGQGTAERSAQGRGRDKVAERQLKLKYVARRAVAWAISVASQGGRIPLPGNMLAFDFSMPARMTVDDGREARAEQEALKNRAMSMTDYQAARGQTAKAHYLKLANDEADALEAAQEVSARRGVDIDPATLTNPEQNETGSTEDSPEGGEDGNATGGAGTS